MAGTGKAKKTAPRLGTRKRYDHVSAEYPGITFTQPSLAQSEFVRDADINQLLQRFTENEDIPYHADRALYGDFSDLTSYDDAINRLRAAEEQFNALPSDVRSYFDNDPANLVGAFDALDAGNTRVAHDLASLGFQGLVPPQPEHATPRPAPAQPAERPPSTSYEHAPQHAPQHAPPVGDPAIGRHVPGGERSAGSGPPASQSLSGEGEAPTHPPLYRNV